MIHLWLANAGLLQFAPGLILRAAGHPAASIALGVGAALSALGAYAFAWQVWLTRRDAPPPEAAPVPVSRRTLRVLDEHIPVTEAIAGR